MLFLARISVLPAGLLALLAIFPCPAYGQELRWPYNLQPHVKYYPEDERLVRREESIQETLQRHSPVGVKKMSNDEGEKFFLDYWAFAPAVGDGSVWEEDWRLRQHGDSQSSAPCNGTIIKKPTPPFLRHPTQQSTTNRFLPRNLRSPSVPRSEFGKRDFQCPGDTSSCASIDRSDSCCSEGQTCQLIDDTGLGDVGCCEAGETCAGALSDCAPGYTSCPGYAAGGCCVPGYACVSGGCLFRSTATVVVTPSTSSSIPPPPSTTVAVSPSAPSVSISSVSTAILATSTPDESTVAATTTATSSCSSGFRSCPTSLGGGCCPTDRACGSDVCPELTSTATVGAPVRPTSDAPSTTSDASITGCPTGYYACSAFYQGGCCRQGRDCAPTSCPSSDTTPLIDDNGVTVVATASSGLSANNVLTGACATGWSSCAASDGGGCCLSGFSCGSSCTATATDPGVQGSEIAKIAPNKADSRSSRGKVSVGIAMSLVALLSVAA